MVNLILSIMKKSLVLLALAIFVGSMSVNVVAQQDTTKQKKECTKDTTKCKKASDKKCCDKTKK
jgi:hypothetical protein